MSKPTAMVSQAKMLRCPPHCRHQRAGTLSALLKGLSMWNGPMGCAGHGPHAAHRDGAG
ncbi:protein of unknown function [Methylorubrum extorquens]|uniref:Uncharacterized protein n=1 Tax=Methylorubrum extorquens TaxID=408 RepID=A0A2N9AYW0_METEX|nr:protein of unknown function [Methylorubrum extorquens]